MKATLPYLKLLIAIIAIVGVAHFAPDLFLYFEHNQEHELLLIFFLIALLGGLSFIVHYLSEQTILPSFVVGIFFGIAAHPLLLPIIEENAVLGALVSFGATLILFGGGLEVPFKNFRKLFLKIMSLSFVGLLLTVVLFSFSLYALGGLLGQEVPVMVAVLLGAVLASTDPAAIIPILRTLRFEKRAAKDIVISESALTDVVGTLLTIVFLTAMTGVVMPDTVGAGLLTLFQQESILLLGNQIFYGVLFGMIGYICLELLLRVKKKHIREYEADSAFFMCVPIMAFVAALALGGSGYLAAFLAGLLLMLTEHLHDTERFFNQTIDGFLKPIIFLLLGALVNIQELLEYAGIGIAIALVFMLVIRPLSVFLSLGPFVLFFKEKLRWRDLLFVSFVRETGAIPAVLLVTIISMGFTGLDGLVPIGMWVILLTLIIQPPLTPWVAEKLQVATVIEDEHKLMLESGEGEPFVVLGSRGHSFARRLPKVLHWAQTHHVRRVALLVCPEGRYTQELSQSIEDKALQVVSEVNATLEQKGKLPIEFQVFVRKGFLQKNIDTLAKEHDSHISAIFVGRKVLDYRLNQIKELPVPLFFID